MPTLLSERIRTAGEGRISGCQLGKPVALGLAGYGALSIDELVDRTTHVAETINPT